MIIKYNVRDILRDTSKEVNIDEKTVRLILARRINADAHMDSDQVSELNQDINELFLLFDPEMSTPYQSLTFQKTLRSIANWANTCH